MSRDAEAKNLRLYDRRTIERNIKKGLITRKDYEKFLKALDDAKEKGVVGAEIPDLEEDLTDETDEDGDDEQDGDDAVAAEPPPSGSNSH